MGMYFKDKQIPFKVRLSQEQFEYITRLSNSLNCSKSQAMRFVVDTVRLGEKYNENQQANIND